MTQLGYIFRRDGEVNRKAFEDFQDEIAYLKVYGLNSLRLNKRFKCIMQFWFEQLIKRTNFSFC
jgi:hypothetical protein